MKRYPLAIMFVLAMLFPGAAHAVDKLPYGADAKVGKEYWVYATTFGGTSWDDNGIGYFGGTDLFKLKWGIAELGHFSHPAMGDLPGGTRILVRYKKRAVIAITADVGSGGCCHWQLDLHIGVAQALGVPNPAGWVGEVRITVLPGRPVCMTTTAVNKGIKGLGPVSPKWKPGNPLPKVRRYYEGALLNTRHAGSGCTSVRADAQGHP